MLLSELKLMIDMLLSLRPTAKSNDGRGGGISIPEMDSNFPIFFCPSLPRLSLPSKGHALRHCLVLEDSGIYSFLYLPKGRKEAWLRFVFIILNSTAIGKTI